jgi:hypothetical protein
VAIFSVDLVNSRCWTGRQELLALHTLQHQSRGPWPLEAAHSHADDAQRLPLALARALGVCSLHVSTKLNSEGTLVLTSGDTLEEAYLAPLHLTVGGCSRPTLVVQLEEREAWRELDRVLERLRRPLDSPPPIVLVRVDAALSAQWVSGEDTLFVDLWCEFVPTTIDESLMRRVRRISTSAEGAELASLVAFARSKQVPIAALNAPRHLWDGLLRQGINLLGSSDLESLRSFLRQVPPQL